MSRFMSVPFNEEDNMGDESSQIEVNIIYKKNNNKITRWFRSAKEKIKKLIKKYF